MRFLTPICVTGLVLLAVSVASPALAQSILGFDLHNDTHHYKDNLRISISLSDREVIQQYQRKHYQPHCPPGLAKKHNGCLPPGIAKKYAMGQPLPPGIASKRLPDDLISQLQPIAGYQYVQVDNDVLLVSAATQKVMDAVALLSAVK